MSTNGETADLMVREGIQITESALKLAGLGAKNLAALLIALANDNQKLAGKTNLKRLIHDGEELTIFSVKQEDLKGFQMEAKRYGVLFYPIVNKVEKTGTVEIMAKAKDAKQINRIFERMGYPAPVKEDTAAKKENARAPSENSLKERGTGARASTEPAAEKADARPSVRSRLIGNAVRTLFQHLCHYRSAGAGRRGYRICRAYWAGNGESLAFGGVGRQKQKRRYVVL